MKEATFPNLEPLLIPASQADFIIIGELHGIIQNALVLQTFVDKLVNNDTKIILALEWLLTPTETESLNDFLEGKVDSVHTPDFFFNSDGRVTIAHLDLLRHLRTINQQQPGRVRLFPFDHPGGNSEEEMSKKLSSLRKKTADTILVSTGVVHAQIDMTIESKQTSLATRLTERGYEIFNIFLFYQTGKVAVEGEIHDVKSSYTQQNGPRNAFQAVIRLPLASPAVDTLPLTFYSD